MIHRAKKRLWGLCGTLAGVALVCGTIYAGNCVKVLNETHSIIDLKSEQKSNIERRSEIKSHSEGGTWLRYESRKGTRLTDLHKQYMDNLVKRWTQGKFTDNELSEILTDYVQKQNITISSAGILSGQRCLFETEADIPDYTKQLDSSDGIYNFIGVYSNGEFDEEGNLICYYWEARIQ